MSSRKPLATITNKDASSSSSYLTSGAKRVVVKEKQVAKAAVKTVSNSGHYLLPTEAYRISYLATQSATPHRQPSNGSSSSGTNSGNKLKNSNSKSVNNPQINSKQPIDRDNYYDDHDTIQPSVTSNILCTPTRPNQLKNRSQSATPLNKTPQSRNSQTPTRSPHKSQGTPNSHIKSHAMNFEHEKHMQVHPRTPDERHHRYDSERERERDRPITGTNTTTRNSTSPSPSSKPHGQGPGPLFAAFGEARSTSSSRSRYPSSSSSPHPPQVPTYPYTSPYAYAQGYDHLSTTTTVTLTKHPLKKVDTGDDTDHTDNCSATTASHTLNTLPSTTTAATECLDSIQHTQTLTSTPKKQSQSHAHTPKQTPRSSNISSNSPSSSSGGGISAEKLSANKAAKRAAQTKTASGTSTPITSNGSSNNSNIPSSGASISSRHKIYGNPPGTPIVSVSGYSRHTLSSGVNSNSNIHTHNKPPINNVNIHSKRPPTSIPNPNPNASLIPTSPGPSPGYLQSTAAFTERQKKTSTHCISNNVMTVTSPPQPSSSSFNINQNDSSDLHLNNLNLNLLFAKSNISGSVPLSTNSRRLSGAAGRYNNSNINISGYSSNNNVQGNNNNTAWANEDADDGDGNEDLLPPPPPPPFPPPTTSAHKHQHKHLTKANLPMSGMHPNTVVAAVTTSASNAHVFPFGVYDANPNITNIERQASSERINWNNKSQSLIESQDFPIVPTVRNPSTSFPSLSLRVPTSGYISNSINTNIEKSDEDAVDNWPFTPLESSETPANIDYKDNTAGNGRELKRMYSFGESLSPVQRLQETSQDNDDVDGSANTLMLSDFTAMAKALHAKISDDSYNTHSHLSRDQNPSRICAEDEEGNNNNSRSSLNFKFFNNTSDSFINSQIKQLNVFNSSTNFSISSDISRNRSTNYGISNNITQQFIDNSNGNAVGVYSSTYLSMNTNTADTTMLTEMSNINASSVYALGLGRGLDPGGSNQPHHQQNHSFQSNEQEQELENDNQSANQDISNSNNINTNNYNSNPLLLSSDENAFNMAINDDPPPPPPPLTLLNTDNLLLFPEATLTLSPIANHHNHKKHFSTVNSNTNKKHHDNNIQKKKHSTEPKPDISNLCVNNSNSDPSTLTFSAYSNSNSSGASSISTIRGSKNFVMNSIEYADGYGGKISPTLSHSEPDLTRVSISLASVPNKSKSQHRILNRLMDDCQREFNEEAKAATKISMMMKSNLTSNDGNGNGKAFNQLNMSDLDCDISAVLPLSLSLHANSGDGTIPSFSLQSGHGSLGSWSHLSAIGGCNTNNDREAVATPEHKEEEMNSTITPNLSSESISASGSMSASAGFPLLTHSNAYRSATNNNNTYLNLDLDGIGDDRLLSHADNLRDSSVVGASELSPNILDKGMIFYGSNDNNECDNVVMSFSFNRSYSDDVMMGDIIEGADNDNAHIK